MKKTIVFIVQTVLLLLFLISCNEPEYVWYMLNDFDTGKYFTDQDGTYMCGFATECTWLRWLNKDPNNPSIDKLAQWYSYNGYGIHIKDVGTSFDVDFPEIFHKASMDLVPFANRILLRPNLINGDNYFKDLRDSILLFNQPVTVHVKNYYGDSHVMLSYGFVCNKKNMSDFGSYLKFKIIDGNMSSTNGRVIYSREELSTQVQQYGYNCDARAIGSSMPW